MDALVYRTAKQSDADPRDYVLSDESVDRYGEVITAGGWNLQNFKNHPIALFNHHSDAIIGRWENVRIEGRKLLGRLILAAEGTSATVDEVRRLWQQKMLRAVSVGFRPLDKEKLSETADEYFGPFRYLKQELVEASLVAVPANPNALQVSRSFVLPADARKQLFGKLAPQEPSPRDRRSPASSPGLLPSGMKTMKLSDQIKTAQRELTGLRDKLTDLSNNDEPDDDEVQLSEQLPIEIEAATRKLERLQNMERALATRAAAEAVEDPPLQTRQAATTEIQRPFAVPKKKIEPADLLVRSAALLAMSYGRREPLQAMLAANYGNDEATGLILRAATAPALMTTVGWAAELVETVNAAFIDRLLEDSIYAPLSNRGARFTFGRAGAIKIPGRASSPRVAGSWVGEAQPKPVRQAAFTSITLSPFKLAVISVFSEEIAEHSTPAIEQILRQAMQDDTGAAIDGYLIDNVAASAVRPAGLLAGLSTLTPSADANKTNAMIADIKLLRQTIINQNGGRDIVLIMNSAQSTGIDLATTPNGLLFNSAAEGAGRFGVGLIVSNTVPAGTVIAVDAADFASATGDVPRYSISDQATIHMEDTTPAAIIGGTSGTPLPAVPTRSLWQTDTIGVRMTWPISWAMRRTGMVSFISGVTW